MAQAESLPVRWALDPVNHDSLMFEGYTAARMEVSRLVDG